MWANAYGSLSEYASYITNELSTTIKYPSLSTALTHTSANLPAGTYKIIVKFSWRVDASNRAFYATVKLNGSPIMTFTKFTTVTAPLSGSVNDFYDNFVITALTGVNTIAVQYCVNSNGSGTAFISDIQIGLYRIQ
jgi:hypothetical protein